MKKLLYIDFKEELSGATASLLRRRMGASPQRHAVSAFLSNWNNADSFIEVRSSGSTGAPKVIKIPKAWMKASAALTLEKLGIRSGQKALLCISAEHIGGMMMIVRAMMGGLKLFILEPSSFPRLNKRVDLTALVPLQAYKIWEQKYSFEDYGTVLIGGAALSPLWAESLAESHSPIFATYGMTEAVSHVALKRIDGLDPDAYFHCLPGVVASTGDAGNLILDIEHFDDLHLETNDLVDLRNEKSFKWLGRLDQVINSGGLKVLPEEVEEKIRPHLKSPFFISSEADERLGQRLILCVKESIDPEKLMEELSKELKKQELPRRIYVADSFKKSATEKILKKDTLSMAQLLWSKEV